MTIRFNRKLSAVTASVMLLALGAAPSSFAGEDDGPTANGERVGTIFNSQSGSSKSSGSGSGSGGSKSSNHSSAAGGVKGAQFNTAAVRRDTTKATGAAQTGFGGMSETPGGSVLFTLLVGLGGAAAVFGARGLAPINRRSDR